MTLNPQEQKTIVKERHKELFRDHIGQFLLLPSHFLKFSDIVSVFPEIKKCLHDWRANVIHYFEHFRS